MPSTRRGGSTTLAALLAVLFALPAFTPLTSPVAVAPSPWVLLESSSKLAVFLQSAQIERHRPDSLTGVWLRFVHTQPQPASRSPNGPRVKQIDVHVGLDCHTPKVRASWIILRDSLDRVLESIPVPPTGQEQVDIASMTKNSIGAACAWLNNPNTPPIHLRD
jgi:hypothetical protein